MLCRKRHLKMGCEGKLYISLLDDDSFRGFGFWKIKTNRINKPDFLGSAEIDLGELKQPGVHVYDLKMNKETLFQRDPASLRFTAEYISFNSKPFDSNKESARADSVCLRGMSGNGNCFG